MQDYYIYPEDTPTVEYSYANIANYLPNGKLPPYNPRGRQYLSSYLCRKMVNLAITVQVTT